MSETIRIDFPEREGDYALFKRGGWTFGHLRRWEDAISSAELAGLVSERLAGWHFTNEAGEEIPFAPTVTVKGAAQPNPKVLDDLPAEAATWLVTRAYPQAYRMAGRPDPNG